MLQSEDVRIFSTLATGSADKPVIFLDSALEASGGNTAHGPSPPH